ncbi:kelch-like protein 24 [Gigantopelta aegis]|uniref:kelch-like protein 24 n=1 Tax=Gigantopelta aegis TaxID=1735272 RepID=UPI001B889E13|nr:kelch-like protein 24 [Gigantopelta aegis]
MDDFYDQLFLNIHQEMINGSFTDMQVLCTDGTITGSRLVLASLSPYFRAMLISDTTESRTGVLELPSVSLPVFQDILKMIFCRVNLVDEDNCMQVMDAADMMQLDHIKQLCKIYLNQSLVLTPENCLHWWRTLKNYNFLDLSKRALSCFTDNLADLLKTENVIQLSRTELLEIISSDDLTCKEDDILKAAMQWIEHNNPDVDDCQYIFENVRLDIINRQFLVNEVVCAKFVLENNAVMNMIQQVIRSPQPQIRSTTRFVANRPDVFVLHHNGKLLLSCFTSEEKWEDVLPAPVDPGSDYSAASLEGKIYITGGLYHDKCTLVYDTIRKVWNRGPDLNHGHWYHCTATASSKVYVISGWDTSAIEEKSESEEQWQVVGDLRLVRVDAFPLIVGENIFVMGGQIHWRKSDLIQCFNTRTCAVTKLDTKLLCSSSTLRGSVHLPDVYLLDNGGNMMHIQVTDRNGEIQIESKLLAEWKCGDFFGIVRRNRNLLRFTTSGIRKFNLAEGKEDEGTFIEPHRSDFVYNVLTM